MRVQRYGFLFIPPNFFFLFFEIHAFLLFFYWFSLILQLSHRSDKCGVRADLPSGRIDDKHLQCDNRIKNPYTKFIGIANPDERH